MLVRLVAGLTLALAFGCAEQLDARTDAAQLDVGHQVDDAAQLDVGHQVDDAAQLDVGHQVDAGRPCNGAQPCPPDFSCVIRLGDGSVGAYCEPAP